MADYSFNPQFANLSGLQPLPAIDVTRGANLQFRPLDKIEIQSSRPELVTEGIAGAVTDIAKGALGGITANFEKKEEEEREKRKYAHELMLYGVKSKSDNADFFAKEEARFISENSGKPGFAKKYDEFKKAYSGFSNRVPERQFEKKPSDFETVEPPLPEQQPELKAEFLSPVEEMKDAKPLSAIPISTSITTGTPAALSELPAPQIPPQVVTTQQKEAQKPSLTDEYEEPVVPATLFDTEPEAKAVASEINKALKETNPDYRIEVKQDKDGFSYLSPISIRKERLSEEREERKARIEEEKLLLQQEKAEREAKKSEQEMQIRQQKVKDENQTLFIHVEDAANSLKAINKAIEIINNNPNYSVGKASSAIARIPMIDTDASRIRGYLNTITGQTAINAITSMRNASPTGAAVGNTSDREMQIFRDTEGPLDPDTQAAEDIIPVLKEIYRKRLKIYNDSVEILKANNQEYTSPPLEYPKEQKKKPSKTKSAKEMVSVISPDGKSGKIPRSQLEAAMAEGYKAQ